MKTVKTYVNPIHRDLLIALSIGFSMAVIIVSTVVYLIGINKKGSLREPFLLVLNPTTFIKLSSFPVGQIPILPHLQIPLFSKSEPLLSLNQ
jgi:hypothetical protein